MNTSPESANPRHSAWSRLTSAARRADAMDTRDTAAPYGFATRVAAQALGRTPAETAPILAKLTLRILGIACLLAIVSLSINLGSILRDIEEEATALGSATPIEVSDTEAGVESTPSAHSVQ